MRSMKSLRAVTPIMVVLLLAVAAGCSDDDDKVAVPPEELDPPHNLTFINFEGEVVLSWDSSDDASRSDFNGYAVYRHTSSMVGATPAELAEYRLNRTPTALTYYEDDGVEEGTRYYYAVRAALDDGRLSEPSNEIHTAPRPEFFVDALHEFAATGQPSGLRCSDGEAFSMRIANKDSIDVYLGTTDPNDDPGFPLALKSPHLVASTHDWSDRVSGLMLLDSFDEGTTPDENWADHVVLGDTQAEVVGRVVAVRIPVSAEGEYHYAKIEVETMSGAAGERSLALRVAWQPIPDYIRFRERP